MNYHLSAVRRYELMAGRGRIAHQHSIIGMNHLTKLLLLALVVRRMGIPNIEDQKVCTTPSDVPIDSKQGWMIVRKSHHT
jgi:hypothetical protein